MLRNALHHTRTGRYPSEQILAGTFDIDSITDDVDVRDIVKAMSHHDPANPLTSDS
jgi:hypothetical protein